MRRWWRDAVFYQVYPRSFMDANGDGVGDLRGIIDRLDYLRGTPESLDVDAIWLSPVYRSPMSDFGYDISDHCDVDPVFGDLDDLDDLIDQAHRRGLRVILDLVPNHTSDRHPWFLASRRSREDPKRDWYVWRDGKAGGPPNNWMAEFRGVGSAWTHDPSTDQWYLHSFQPSQPDLNWDNPDVEAAMHDVVRHWLRRGVDGFRIDVVHKIGKAPDLRDNLGLMVGPGRDDRGRRFDEDWPSAHERIRRLRRTAKAFGAVVLVGEVYLLDADQMAAYVRTGLELDLAHNFEFLTLPWDASAIRTALAAAPIQLGGRGWPTWCFNNHDHSRVVSRYGGEASARIAAMLLLTVRGTPFLYQGEELGLADGIVEPHEVVDIDGRDPERCPIPWESPGASTPFAGFSSVRPWLPIGPDAATKNVRAQLADPGSVLQLYRTLLAVRRRAGALRGGEMTLLEHPSADVIAFRRSDGRSQYVTVLNLGRDATAIGTTLAPGRMGRVIISTDAPSGTSITVQGDSIVPPQTGYLIQVS